MRRASKVPPTQEFPVFVGPFLTFLCLFVFLFCPLARTVWLTPWRPAHGMKKHRRRRDLRRAAARQDRAKGQRTEETGPSPESR